MLPSTIDYCTHYEVGVWHEGVSGANPGWCMKMSAS